MRPIRFLYFSSGAKASACQVSARSPTASFRSGRAPGPDRPGPSRPMRGTSFAVFIYLVVRRFGRGSPSTPSFVGGMPAVAAWLGLRFIRHPLSLWARSFFVPFFNGQRELLSITGGVTRVLLLFVLKILWHHYAYPSVRFPESRSLVHT